MCGRFGSFYPAEGLAEHFELDAIPALEPRFNITPGSPIAVVRRPSTEGPRELARLYWGLVPHWAKDPAGVGRTINARSETAAEKPAFRQAFARRRALIPADGFYEWTHRSEPGQPYFYRLTGHRTFAFAGLWERWEHDDRGVLESCTILTTRANRLIRPVHHRMPVILAPEAYEVWLDTVEKSPAELQSLCVPFPAEEMTGYPVNSWVNHPGHEGPRCIEPLNDGQLSWLP